MTPSKVPDPQGKTPDQETLDLLAELDRDFGKKKGSPEAAHKALNKQWHAANQPLQAGKGKVPERMRPEDSTAWLPIARVTHVVIQECACCSETCEFIGGEFVKFRSTRAYGGEILRRSENCANLFLIHELEHPLEDLIEWHYQKVARCPGCVRVDQQAQAIIWDQELEAQRKSAQQLKLDLDLSEVEVEELE